MKRKRILLVFGTRPEAVKMAPVALELAKHKNLFETRIVVTAQHRGLLDQVLRLFRLRPAHDLDIMRPGQSLTDISVRALSRLAPVYAAERPDLVLVHGDTTTTLFASLAAFYRGIPVGHVEAGLRTHDLRRPFPEEANRLLTDRLAALHFAPTAEARRNLLAEGIPPGGILVTGNTGIDALRLGLERLRGNPPSLPRAAAKMAERPFVLVTAHRRENFGRPLREAFQAIRDVAQAKPDLGFIYPVHPNPNVRGPAREILGRERNVALTRPLDYAPFIQLLERCLFVVTDSGGIQEEAPSLGKPVLVLRHVTERPEAVRAGTARLAGSSRGEVRRWILRLLDDRALYRGMARAINPYGDGRASPRIVAALRRWRLSRG